MKDEGLGMQKRRETVLHFIFRVHRSSFRRVFILPPSSLILCFFLVTFPVPAQEKVQISVEVAKSCVKIDRNIFGQFAEHLGHGVYEGMWVGPDFKIPNTRGIRNDVVAALKAIKVPNIRWPGGCFADEYHWRKGIGPADKRVATLN